MTSTVKQNLIISEAAAADIRDIALYIATQNTYAAERFVISLKERLQVLAEQPSIGRTRDELLEGVRSFTINDHVIFYKTDDDSVKIGRVLHGSRDVQTTLNKKTLKKIFPKNNI